MLKRDETTAAHIAFLSMREDSTPVTFRDVVAVLVMLTVVTALALIVIGMIYLFGPPTPHGPRPIRVTEGMAKPAAHCAAPANSTPCAPRSACNA